MKKKVLFLIILLVLFINFASAEYFCSDGTEASSSRKEIERYDAKTINDLGIGILDSREHAVLRKLEVVILADARGISLTNTSINLKLASGTYSVKLVNATANSANIQIGSSSKTLNEKEIDSIGDLQVLITEADLSNGIPSAEIIAGKEKLRLDSQNSPRQILTFGSSKYGVELISASYSSAIISVSKCETGNLSEKSSEAENETAINQTIANETNEETNQSKINITEATKNQTIANETKKDAKKKEEVSFLRKLWFWLAAMIFAILIFYILYSKITRKKNS